MALARDSSRLAWLARLIIGRSGRHLLPPIIRPQHIYLTKQQAAARGPVARDLASSHPSVNGANFHATQLRNFALRQKLFARGAVVPHSPSPSFDLRSAIRRLPGCRVTGHHCSEITWVKRTRCSQGRTGVQEQRTGTVGLTDRSRAEPDARTDRSGALTGFCCIGVLERHLW